MKRAARARPHPTTSTANLRKSDKSDADKSDADKSDVFDWMVKYIAFLVVFLNAISLVLHAQTLCFISFECIAFWFLFVCFL